MLLLNNASSLRRDDLTLGNKHPCENMNRSHRSLAFSCQSDIPEEECKEDFFDPRVIQGKEKRCLTLLAFSIVRLSWIEGISEGEVIAENEPLGMKPLFHHTRISIQDWQCL